MRLLKRYYDAYNQRWRKVQDTLASKEYPPQKAQRIYEKLSQANSNVDIHSQYQKLTEKFNSLGSQTQRLKRGPFKSGQPQN
mmetsp:Transcript_11690/g.10161  ORF Transcript_11690/g.10161 Transcript_11690/m.10161 type:complete len:82 (-) Transcript_11690:711-956(-)